MMGSMDIEHAPPQPSRRSHATATPAEIAADQDIVPLHRLDVALYEERRLVADMSPLAAEALGKKADADVKIAEATHAIPAKQETLKVGIVVGAVCGLTLLGVLIVPPTHVYGVIVVGLVALAGLWGAPEATKKWRSAL